MDKKSNILPAIVFILIFLIAGCSQKQKTRVEGQVEESKIVSVQFERPLGIATIEFDEEGRFVSMTAKASAPLSGNNAEGVEQAITVATLRAKRNISEFIETELSSSRTLNVMSDGALQRRSSEDSETLVVNDADYNLQGENSNKQTQSDDQELRKSQKVTENVTEFISTSSENILRGLQITDETVNNEQMNVVVEVRVTREQIAAARNLKDMME